MVHVDIVEMEVDDVHGRRYGMVLVEDLTRGKWVYPLKLKSDAGASLQAHCRQEGPMSILRADGDGAFGGKAASPKVYAFGDTTGVLAVCSMYGIRRQETVPEAHDQMGVAEAAIRRGTETARTLLYAANLPKQFWAHALQHWAAVDGFTVNTAKGASPYKLRYGEAPVRQIRKLRTFGARVSFYGNRDDATKLDMPGHRGVYLGTNSDNGGYIILDVEAVDAVVVTTVDVQQASFDEVSFREPVGCDDDDLRFTQYDLPRMSGFAYPPVRAIHETVLAPSEGLLLPAG